MAGHRLGVFRRGRAVEQVKAERPVLDPVPQHIDHPAPRDLALQAGQELPPRHALLVFVVRNPQLAEFVWLRGQKEGEQVHEIYRILAVVGNRMPGIPAAAAVIQGGLGRGIQRAGEQPIPTRHVPHDQAFQPFFGGGPFEPVLHVMSLSGFEADWMRQRILVQFLFVVGSQGRSIRDDPCFHASRHEQHLIVLRAVGPLPCRDCG
jgi:hypothetical protein